MNARHETLLWALQRVTAVVLAFCVLVHLATIIYAVRGGLTAADVLGRTHGSYLWAVFYSTFVVAVAIHAAIGLRAIAAEWLAFRGRPAHIVASLIGLGLAALGLRAVVAVIA